MGDVQGIDVAVLRKNVEASFTLSELNAVLFDLSIDLENIPGTQKEEKIIELIRYSQRRGRLLELITSFEASRPHIQWRQQITAQSASRNTVEARSQHRTQLYKQAEDLQLVHTILPSKRLENYWDILIYLIRHQSNDLSFVKQAEFFLGRYWGNEIFTVPNQDDFIGITISAYGPTLCTCRVILTGNREVMLTRYLDFEMTSLFTQNKTDNQTTKPSELEIMIDTSVLAERMKQNFDLNEIEMLAFDLGMDIGELSGMTNHARATALVQYSQGHKRLPELLERLQSERPHVQWKE